MPALLSRGTNRSRATERGGFRDSSSVRNQGRRARPAEGELVFAAAEGRSLGAKGIVRYASRKPVEASGVAAPAPTLHDARQAYATHALRAGLTLHAVARLLGHRDVSLVARRYGHALPDELADAGRILDRFRGASG